MDFDPDRLARSPFIIGGFGALVTALRFTPGASWLEKAANVVAGALPSGNFAAKTWYVGARGGASLFSQMNLETLAIYETAHSAATVERVSRLIG